MLDIPALRQLCEAATKGPWVDHDDSDGTESRPLITFTHDELGETAVIVGSCFWNYGDAAFIAAAREALPAALAEIASLRAELAAAREKKPVAWAIFNDRMSWPVVGCDEAEIRGNATMTGDRVVPLIIPPGAGG